MCLTMKISINIYKEKRIQAKVIQALSPPARCRAQIRLAEILPCQKLYRSGLYNIAGGPPKKLPNFEGLYLEF